MRSVAIKSEIYARVWYGAIKSPFYIEALGLESLGYALVAPAFRRGE